MWRSKPAIEPGLASVCCRSPRKVLDAQRERVDEIVFEQGLRLLGVLGVTETRDRIDPADPDAAILPRLHLRIEMPQVVAHLRIRNAAGSRKIGHRHQRAVPDELVGCRVLDNAFQRPRIVVKGADDNLRQGFGLGVSEGSLAGLRRVHQPAEGLEGAGFRFLSEKVHRKEHGRFGDRRPIFTAGVLVEERNEPGRRFVPIVERPLHRGSRQRRAGGPEILNNLHYRHVGRAPGGVHASRYKAAAAEMESPNAGPAPDKSMAAGLAEVSGGDQANHRVSASRIGRPAVDFGSNAQKQPRRD
jgi:hypothetical protein